MLRALLSASSGRPLAAVPMGQAVRQTGWFALVGLLQVVLVGQQADGQVVLEDLGVFELRGGGQVAPLEDLAQQAPSAQHLEAEMVASRADGRRLVRQTVSRQVANKMTRIWAASAVVRQY